MDPLTAALACTLTLTDLPVPAALPHWEERNLTVAERAHTDRPRDARALYDWRTETIISPPRDWPALVHEMVHHLEWSGHYWFSDRRADAAERRANDCLNDYWHMKIPASKITVTANLKHN